MQTTKIAMLHVLCARPGMFRGGVAHPAHKAHRLDAFTEGQLHEMLADPAIKVVIGEQLLPDRISDMLGVAETGRTRVVGAHVETDAGASMMTEHLAHANDLRDDVKRAEGAAELEREVEAIEVAAVTGTAAELREGAQADALDLASAAGAGVPAATTSADAPPVPAAKTVRRAR